MSVRHALIMSALLFGCGASSMGPNTTATRGTTPGRPVSPMATTDTGAVAAARPGGAVPPGALTDPSPTRRVPPSRDADDHPMQVEARSEGTDPRTMSAEARPSGRDDMSAAAPPMAQAPPIDRIEVSPGAPGADAELVLADDDVTRAIRVALDTDQNLSPAARNVVITTHEGVVTLTGRVPTANERARIDAHARSAPGVSQVENRVRVAR